MRLLLALVIAASAQPTASPVCAQGVVYNGRIIPYNSSITQHRGQYTCYFRIHYSLDNLSDCSMSEFDVVVDFVRESTARNNTGECFYSYEWGLKKRRYLQCQCEEDGCNGHIQNIRAMFDIFRHQLNKENKTIEEVLLHCVERRLDSLGLFPLPPDEATTSGEDDSSITQFFQWQALLFYGGWGLLFLLCLGLFCKKCCCRRSSEAPYKWNVFDPEEQGVCLPTDSQEDIRP